MTHFRFRYKRVGYMRWRCRSAQRRTSLLILPLGGAVHYAPSTAAWRRAVPLLVPMPNPHAILKVGDFIVGPEEDPQLFGHPDIRY